MLCSALSTTYSHKARAAATGATMLLVVAAFLTVGCNMSVSHSAPTALAVQARIPAEVLAAAQHAVEQEVSTLGLISATELQQIEYKLILVDDAGLLNGGSSRARLVADLEAETPAPANEPAYLTRIFSWNPGQTASVEINSLNADARYLIVLKAELEFSEGNPLTVFGFTRVLTRAGQTTAAQVLLGGSPAPLVAALLEWYSIVVQLEASLLGGPVLSDLPPPITNQQNISFTATAESGVTFIYSATGPTTIEDTEVEDTDLSGSEVIELTGLQEGTYTVSVRYREQDGIESEPSVFVVAIDITPPAAPTFIDPPTLTNITSPSFTVSGEAGATFVYSVSGDTVVPETSVPDTAETGMVTITLGPLNDGMHEVSVYLIDPAGNVGAESVFSLEVNTALPDAPVITVPPPSPTNMVQPSFTVTGLAGGTFVYSVSGATTIANTDVPDTGDDGVETITLPLLNEGVNTVSVFVRDAANNEGAPATFDVEIDTTPPPVPTNVLSSDLQGTPPNEFTYLDMPIFTWIGSGEFGAEWEYSTDGGMTWITTAVESATLGPLAAGMHQFRVRERDLAGNLSGEPPLIEFEYIPVGEATITISNPLVPTFTLSPAGFTLDVNGNGGWPTVQVVQVVPDAGITIDAYEWIINNEVLTGEGDPSLEILASWATDPGHPTMIGVNSLTLIVEINGTPYSDNFFFTVEDN